MRISRLGMTVLAFPAFSLGQSIAPAAPDAIQAQTQYREPRVRDFAAELGRNYAALLAVDNIQPAVFGGLATAAAFVPQKRMEGYFRDRPKSTYHEIGDTLGDMFFAAPSIGATFVAGRLSKSPKFRSFSYSVAQGFTVNQTVVFGLKSAIRSRRPNGEALNSFPSGHTSGAFTTATIASRYYGKKVGIPAFIAAGFVGYSRLDDRAHRFTDVVAGAALGYIVGRTVSRRAAFDPTRRLTWNVAVPPGGGVGLALQIRPPW